MTCDAPSSRWLSASPSCPPPNSTGNPGPPTSSPAPKRKTSSSFSISKPSGATGVTSWTKPHTRTPPPSLCSSQNTSSCASIRTPAPTYRTAMKTTAGLPPLSSTQAAMRSSRGVATFLRARCRRCSKPSSKIPPQAPLSNPRSPSNIQPTPPSRPSSAPT